MSWYAVDAIDDALDATRAFLFPLSLGRWARLALITLFLGGSGVGVQNVAQFANSAGQFAGFGPGPGSPSGGSFALATLFAGGNPGGTVPMQVGPGGPGGVPAAFGVVGLLVIAAVALLALLFTLAGPVFEFVFVDAIATNRVRVRGPFGRHFWKGMRLLVFQIGVGILFAVPFVAIGAAAFLTGGAPPELGVPVILALVALVLLWVLAFVLVMGFTTQFVVPVMYVDDVGVLAGWSRVWGLLAGEKKQTLVYLFLHLLVGIGVSLVRGLLSLVGLIPVGLVALVVGFGAGALVGGTVATNLGLGAGVLAGLAVGLPLYFVFVVLPLNVLTRTYLRTYELASLGGFDSRYDLVGRYRDDDGDGDGVRGETPPGEGPPDRAVGDDADDVTGVDAGTGSGFGEFVPANDRFGDDDTDDSPRTSGFRTGAELFAR